MFFQKMKNSLHEENLKYLKKFKYFKSTSHFRFQLVSDPWISILQICKHCKKGCLESKNYYTNYITKWTITHKGAFENKILKLTLYNGARLLYILAELVAAHFVHWS